MDWKDEDFLRAREMQIPDAIRLYHLYAERCQCMKFTTTFSAASAKFRAYYREMRIAQQCLLRFHVSVDYVAWPALFRSE